MQPMHMLSPPSVQSTAQDAPFLTRETFSAACINVPVLRFFFVTHFHVRVYVLTQPLALALRSTRHPAGQPL
jgi:hypothetical protein